jgi:hypothetical protein
MKFGSDPTTFLVPQTKKPSLRITLSLCLKFFAERGAALLLRGELCFLLQRGRCKDLLVVGLEVGRHHHLLLRVRQDKLLHEGEQVSTLGILGVVDDNAYSNAPQTN